MASKTIALTTFALSLNLLFFTLVSSHSVYPDPNPNNGKCPVDTLKLGVCANVLNGLVRAIIGTPPSAPGPCCSVIKDLLDLEAAACLCTVLNVDVANILKLRVPIALSALLNTCGKKLPEGFKCPNIN
ncbi:hypothetical protein Sjap_020391 [Stephania japonica]|uniref:Bifunctional inhibitor/plant lipid transfer protein/seed storage helical domain-containing protein n=1 Tax=Stephania japonica TaxID=461633 RepID=A0AAP0HYY8_9MAGN